MENYIRFEAINEEFGTQFAEQFQPFDDVPTLVAKAVYGASGSSKSWEELDDKKQSKKESKAKKRLNRGAVENMTLARLEEVDAEGEVMSWLAAISLQSQ
ncbi:hypothetical protein [Pseudoalteromonas sp. MMG005]|uniref:hypothetical protein n=1 Tax=Pseudoalteromonas sp. MMG005 TaxID=2822682 RepID=UPI001B39F401|nr:hypothetical protein [Pseudoalteromonas sp. MMG005]MBQ4848158.1 hypothetical protein [Pseudoalteromonas sp. MMG005]